MTYDREVQKFSADELQQLHKPAVSDSCRAHYEVQATSVMTRLGSLALKPST